MGKRCKIWSIALVMVQCILGASVVQEKYKSEYDLTSGANHALAADRKKSRPLKSGVRFLKELA